MGSTTRWPPRSTRSPRHSASHRAISGRAASPASTTSTRRGSDDRANLRPLPDATQAVAGEVLLGRLQAGGRGAAAPRLRALRQGADTPTVSGRDSVLLADMRRCPPSAGLRAASLRGVCAALDARPAGESSATLLLVSVPRHPHRELEPRLVRRDRTDGPSAP